MYIYTHAYTNTYNLYKYMYIYFGHNYVYICIFIVSIIGFAKSHSTVTLTNFNLTPLKTIQLTMFERKGNLYTRLLDISNLVLRHEQRLIFWFHTALITNLNGWCKSRQERQTHEISPNNRPICSILLLDFQSVTEWFLKMCVSN